MLNICNNTVTADTKTLKAVITDGLITELTSKANNKRYIDIPDISKYSGLSIVYPNNRTVDLSNSSQSEVKCLKINDYCAEFRVHSWHGDGIILVREDIETGDLLVEPSAFSGQKGVRSVKWAVPGISQSLELIAPIYQGIKMNMTDPLIKGGRYMWPMFWEAGFAVLQEKNGGEKDKGGFWIYCKDKNYKYKTLNIGVKDDPYALGFETDAYGPIDNNTSAGGLEWRINVFEGDWHVPASYYKKWLYDAYNLDEQRKLRKEWIYDIKAAVSWFPTDIKALDLLKNYVNPSKVLLHIPNWRKYQYDENYPDYTPSEEAKAFFEHGQKLGFHMMPHGNSVDMDPTHRVYQLIRDYEYIDIESKARHGWGWNENGYLGVPSSNLNLTKNRHNKVMIKVHPANKMWQSVLREELNNAVDILNADSVFIDVTLCSSNLHNCLVDSTTPSEGMNMLIRRIGSIRNGIPVGGEGLNEITFQGLSFAQAHLFNSHHSSCEGLERTGNIDLNNFIFGDLCRTFGYSKLSGKTEDEKLRIKIHADHGAIPTVTCNLNDLLNPNETMLEIFSKTKE